MRRITHHASLITYHTLRVTFPFSPFPLFPLPVPPFATIIFASHKLPHYYNPTFLPGEKLMRRTRFTAVVMMTVAASLLMAPAAQSAHEPAQSSDASGASRIVMLLEKSPFKYSKVGDTVWEITFNGETVKEIPIRIALSEDVVIVMGKIADRKKVSLKETALVKLLELNHNFDSVKIALSEDMLYVRVDAHWKIIDGAELKYMLEQVANVVEGTYPQIKQYLV